MRIINIIIGVLISTTICGQQLTFRGQNIDTIFVVSSFSYHHFDDKGTITSPSEHFAISYDKLKDQYIVTNYKSVVSTYTYKPKSFKEKVRIYNNQKEHVIKKELINGLLNSFAVKYIKPTFESIELNQIQFMNLTDEKHIRHIAKIYKQDYEFKFSSKEENEIIYKGCQNIDTFNLFLSSPRFDTIVYLAAFDYTNQINVYLIAGSNKYSFEGKYPNRFKQPWYDHSDTTRIKVPGWNPADSIYMQKRDSFYIPKITSILNFNINSYLSAILPPKFLNRKSIELENLTNEYIKWYLNRRRIIYDSDCY